MTNSAVQPCTVCGALTGSEYLLDKTNDGRGSGNVEIYRCGICNIVYLGKYNESFDDGLYAYYTKYIGKKKEAVYDPLTKKSYLQVLRLFESNGGGKCILDVGCGNGSFVDAALEQGYNIEGIELSQAAVDIAQRFDLPVRKLDFYSNKIHDSSKDVITMFEVIEHLPDPVEFLCRAEIVVRPGGLIYLTTPNFNSLDRRVFGAEWNVFHREHLTYFTLATLLALIRSNTTLEVLHAETRNISGELISHFRNLGWTTSSGNNGHIPTEENGTSTQFDVRTSIAKSKWLSLLKRGANSLLNATSLGSTIVMLLRRPIAVTK